MVNSLIELSIKNFLFLMIPVLKKTIIAQVIMNVINFTFSQVLL